MGSVVWGKFGKTQWWPGIVINGKMVEKETKPGYVWLYWLSDRKLSQVKTKALEPFIKQVLRHLKPKARPEMKYGIQKALQIFAERSQTDMTGYGYVEDWVTDSKGIYGLIQEKPEVLNPSTGSPLPEFVIEDLKRLKGDEELAPKIGTKRKHKVVEDRHPALQETCIACCMHCAGNNKHPLFEGFLCNKCKDVLKKNILSVDYDGCTLTCVICGKVGFLAVCDSKQCGRSYCFECIVQYTSRANAEKVEKLETWKCFLCQEYDKDTHGALVPRQNTDLEMVRFFQDFQVCTDLSYLTNAGKRKIRVLSLFDGIGTGKVVLNELGLDVEVYYCSEVDVDAIAVTQYNHKDGITFLGDAWHLQTQQIKELCPLDLVLAGPPCNDLSIVNPKRSGFRGSGLLVVKFITILKEIEKICRGTTHVFWVMENTGCMLNSYKLDISCLLEMEPAAWDAKHFLGQRRYRNFWGNIPGIYSTPDVLKHLEKEKKGLSAALTQNCNRKAVVECTRTITSQPNSLTITNGKKNQLVKMDGIEDGLWIEEIERLFGFPTNYTNTGGLSDDRRRRLLGKAWSVPVIKQILLPLKQYFKLKDSI